jgi:hypothetical protein
VKHGDFTIGGTFRCGDGERRCTNIGTRTIVAIRIDSVRVGGKEARAAPHLDRAAAEAEGWFNGPPYAVAEYVFDECDIESCSLITEESGSRQDWRRRRWAERRRAGRLSKGRHRAQGQPEASRLRERRLRTF